MAGQAKTRADWRGAALLAALALLVQALLPAAVMARPVSGGAPLLEEICSASGVKTVAVSPAAPQKSKGFGGFRCADCVFASVTATVPQPIGVPVRLARVAQAWFPPSAVTGPVSIRGPPRPPARAPPVEA
jgi:hypothetical protein